MNNQLIEFDGVCHPPCMDGWFTTADDEQQHYYGVMGTYPHIQRSLRDVNVDRMNEALDANEIPLVVFPTMQRK